MGLTKSGPILESVRFVKPAIMNGDILVSLFIDMPCYVLVSGLIIKLMY